MSSAFVDVYHIACDVLWTPDILLRKMPKRRPKRILIRLLGL
jgi:hypothetical protein